MSSNTLSNAKAVQKEYETPQSLGTEDSEFAKYGLSPPTPGRTFMESFQRIQKEFKET
jgi:hypothetical protein